MTSPAAGWYPDPSGRHRERWWDGTGWTEHDRPLEAPTSATPAAPLYTQSGYGHREIPSTTSVSTPWIWIVTLAPFVAILPVFAMDMESILFRSVLDPQFGWLALLLDPAYIATTVLGWLMYAAVVVCSWLDGRELIRRGVDRPFHWAWAFLSSLVYVIGRTIVVGRVAQGRGRAPMWVGIVLSVIAFVAITAWTVWVVTLSIQFAFTQVSFGP